MKKSLLLIALALFSLAVLGQEQLPVQPDEQVQVQPAEPPPAPQALPEGRDLKAVRLGRPFIHAGKEYPAGKYWMVLGEKDGQPMFFRGTMPRRNCCSTTWPSSRPILPKAPPPTFT